MSELFPAPATTPEPTWLKEARRRTNQTGAQTSITAADRRTLLGHYDELTVRCATLAQQHQEAVARATELEGQLRAVTELRLAENKQLCQAHDELNELRLYKTQQEWLQQMRVGYPASKANEAADKLAQQLVAVGAERDEAQREATRWHEGFIEWESVAKAFEKSLITAGLLPQWPAAPPLEREAAATKLTDACEVCAYRQPKDPEQPCPRCGNGIYIAMTDAQAHEKARQYASGAPLEGRDAVAPVETGRIDCPSCGASLAWDNAWSGTGSTCKYCGFGGPATAVEAVKEDRTDEAPDESWLAGNPALGCDAWLQIERVTMRGGTPDPIWQEALQNGRSTAVVRYLRAPAFTKEKGELSYDSVCGHTACGGICNGTCDAAE